MLVQHVVVFQHVFTRIKVMTLYALLRFFKRTRYHLAFDWRCVIDAKRVHHALHAIRSENTHQIIIERHKELRASRIALSASTTTKLIVDTTRFVALCSNDMQATETTHFFRHRRVYRVSSKQNIDTTTRHVRCKRNGALATSLRNNFTFTLVILCV